MLAVTYVIDRERGVTVEEELAALRAEVAALRAMAQESHAIIALGTLQRTYGYYVDKGLWDEAADLFAPDGTLEIAGRGVYKGRERVRAYLHKLPVYRDGILFNHMQLQPVIHVDMAAGTAKGRWRTFIQLGILGAEARWGEAVYENEYVRAGDIWMIAKLHGMITYYTEFDQGWNKGGVPLLRRIDGLEPDAPASIDYEAFPKAFIPPFHYPNPVSGKPWEPGA
jgi:hypothetical protein